MNRLIKYIQGYLIIGFPIVVTAIWNIPFFGGFTQDVLSLHLIFWFSVLTIFLVLLVIMPKARELTLRRLANIKEDDEREEYITGKASRVTYISTLSLLILLFFSSVFSVNVQKLPDNQTSNGHYALNLHLCYSFFEDRSRNKAPVGHAVFDSREISLSKPSILVLLIFWQLLVFNYVARREQIKGFK